VPGLSLVSDLASPVENQLALLLSRDEGGSYEGDRVSVLWRDQHLALLSSGYPEYPITRHEFPDHLVLLEGFIYQAAESPWYYSLPTIAADILHGESRALSRAARWIEQIDGDFVLVIQERRSRDVVIFNDFLGRLPLYVYRTDSILIVSRDLSLIMRLKGRVVFDRLALAEHLLYGYPLGPRTLFNGIERVPASAAFQVRRKAKQTILSSLLVPSAASDPRVTRETLKHKARDISSAFAQASAVRIGRSQGTALSLSGGLDSRSVAAALSGDQLPFRAVTFGSGRPDQANEVRIAAKVAAVLQLDWRTIEFSLPTGSDLLRLLKLKSGMNYLGMGFILPFFDSLQAEFGRGMVFLTGDGGDKILPDHRPRICVPNEEAVVRYVLSNHEVFPLSTVVALTGVSRLDILAALEERILSYPEDNFEEKYIHFILFERGFKWLFEGEDRNRHFFWSATPFYGREPFIRAMSCPAQFKADYYLYHLFMESLSPKLVDVESTTVGSSLRSGRYPMKQFVHALRIWTPPSLRRGWRMLRRPSAPSEVLGCIREQLAPSSPVIDYLSPSHTNAILGRLRKTQAYMLLTLTSAIEYCTTGNSTLERYRNAYFG
jgi:asparagine synthase (glutamine-hydrolysing)